MIRAALVLALLAGGCGLLGPEQVVIGAETSLAGAMAELEAAFEDAHPGTDVVVDLSGGAVLAAQVGRGARVDVIAAGPRTTQALLAGGQGVDDAVPLAASRLAIAVPAGNPREIDGPEDLPGLDLVVAVEEVTVGAHAVEVMGRAGVPLRPASREQDSRSVVARVAAGDADAGLAWAVDIAAARALGGGAGAVEAVLLPAGLQPPGALIEALLLTRRGERLLEFLAGEEAQEILRRAGFRRP